MRYEKNSAFPERPPAAMRKQPFGEGLFNIFSITEHKPFTPETAKAYLLKRLINAAQRAANILEPDLLSQLMIRTDATAVRSDTADKYAAAPINLPMRK